MGGRVFFAFLIFTVGGSFFVFSEAIEKKTIVNVASATYIINNPHNPNNSNKTKSNEVYSSISLVLPNIIYPASESSVPTNFTLMGLAKENSEVEIIFEPKEKSLRKKESKNIVFKTRSDINGYYCIDVKNIPPGFYSVSVSNEKKKGDISFVEVVETEQNNYPQILNYVLTDRGRKQNVIGTSTPDTSIVVYTYNKSKNFHFVDIVGVGTSDKNGKFNITLNSSLPSGENMLFVADTTYNIASSGRYLGPMQDLPPDQGDIYVYNYPNPMSSTTTFRYYLPETSNNVTLEIFNTAGRRLTYFNICGIGKNDPAPPIACNRDGNVITYSGNGWNEWEFDGRTQDGIYLSNGVYIYRLTASLLGKATSKTNKLLILR